MNMRGSLLASLVVMSACTEGGASGQLLPDPPPDASSGGDGGWAPVSCGDAEEGRLVSGRLVELGSSETAFAGIAGATFTQRGGAATGTTMVDGSYQACAAPANTYTFDIDAPGDHVDAIAVIQDHALTPPSDQSLGLRTATASALNTFYAERGLQLDMTRPQVVVVMAGLTWATVELEGAVHDPAHAADDYETPGTFQWKAGAAGRYVLFPNIVAEDGTATVLSPSTETEVPVEPGKVTLVVISDFFCFKAPCV